MKSPQEEEVILVRMKYKNDTITVPGEFFKIPFGVESGCWLEAFGGHVLIDDKDRLSDYKIVDWCGFSK